MSNLVDKKCVSHEKMTLLVPEEIKNCLDQLKQWEVLDGNKIRKIFKFEYFAEAMEFVSRVAEVAEQEGHHPDIVIHYNKVEIILWSHFVSGLSENDFIVAVKVDNI